MHFKVVSQGIALGVIELKRSSVSVSEGIRQNLDNQKKAFWITCYNAYYQGHLKCS